jgi:hypothetical protein
MNFHIIYYPLYMLIIQVSVDSDRMCDSGCMRDSGRMLDPGRKILRSYARLWSKGATPVVCPTPIGRRNSGRMRDFGRKTWLWSYARLRLWHSDSRLNRIDRILIPSGYIFFSRNPTTKNSGVKCAWLRVILGWVTDWEVFSSAYKWG